MWCLGVLKWKHFFYIYIMEDIYFSSTFVYIQIILNVVFYMHFTWSIHFVLLMDTDLKCRERKQEETNCFLATESTEYIHTTIRCTFNAWDAFSSFQVPCRVRCSSPLAMARILQTTVHPQDTIPKCPVKLFHRIWIINIEPVTNLLTIQHQHKMLWHHLWEPMCWIRGNHSSSTTKLLPIQWGWLKDPLKEQYHLDPTCIQVLSSHILHLVITTTLQSALQLHLRDFPLILIIMPCPWFLVPCILMFPILLQLLAACMGRHLPLRAFLQPDSSKRQIRFLARVHQYLIHFNSTFLWDITLHYQLFHLLSPFRTTSARVSLDLLLK